MCHVCLPSLSCDISVFWLSYICLSWLSFDTYYVSPRCLDTYLSRWLTCDQVRQHFDPQHNSNHPAPSPVCMQIPTPHAHPHPPYPPNPTPRPTPSSTSVSGARLKSYRHAVTITAESLWLLDWEQCPIGDCLCLDGCRRGRDVPSVLSAYNLPFSAQCVASALNRPVYFLPIYSEFLNHQLMLGQKVRMSPEVNLEIALT